ncbi:MAG: hypothetical protein AAFY84_07005 [Pseudomonadota bacterium]
MNQKVPSDEFLLNLRANTAFERFLVAALSGASVSGLVFWSFWSIGLLLGGDGVFQALFSGLLPSIGYMFVVFLMGFGAAAFFGFPLWRRFEQDGEYHPALFLAFAVVGLAGAVILVSPNTLQEIISVAVPSILIPLLFYRQARRLAAARKENRLGQPMPH